uniref:Uncharacterized protein n=1 Tax=Ciona intestinalis TaxID=7719 RepID=H2Y3K1_CIOIN
MSTLVKMDCVDGQFDDAEEDAYDDGGSAGHWMMFSTLNVMWQMLKKEKQIEFCTRPSLGSKQIFRVYEMSQIS